ncbi:hypothetical protein A3K64_04245 [Candidatus Micrarchaeota archaeon RBG_16_36_9]|nr:MAG: hypothetical protein A3K64_04245 [Candidatus Micrarchaeota archaeon RBG_16_36_9]
MLTNSMENEVRKETFNKEMRRLERLFNGRPLSPEVYIITGENFSGSSRHIIYDCLGFVKDEIRTSFGVLVKGVIPSSKEDLFRLTTKKYPIYKEAGIQYPGKTELVKKLNS